jgi:cytochrome c oxidase assembly protein subunit 15
MKEILAPVISITEKKNDRQVGIWLLVGVGMVVIQVALGGITRLTGSGLSITEWNVVTGTLPPMGQAAWLAEFEKYKATPQFHLLNSDFGLSDFKSIFFWEWFHRLWARLLGVVFAVGFAYFLLKKKFRQAMVKPFLILFLLGALQGAVGWIMVASGLDGDAVYVKPTRLAVHFVLALGLLCYTFWFALKLMVPFKERKHYTGLKKAEAAILILLVFQLLYGALMAGHKAATAASTWPSINGYLLQPAGLYKEEHGLLNFIDNKIMIHYIHRGLAYLLLVATIIFSYRINKLSLTPLMEKTKWLPAGLVVLQILLGIATVLTSVAIVPNRWGNFEWLALLHQLTGMSFLLAIIWMLYLSSGPKRIAA